MINFLNIPKDAINPPKKEILRYMGINNTPDEKTSLLIDEVVEEMIKECDFKCCFKKFSAKIQNSEVFLGETVINSKSLAKNLENCKEAYLFCATIGINADRIINKYMSFSPEKGVIAQSVGATLIESVCDYVTLIFKEAEKSKFLRARFSPGYGDFPFTQQPDILSVLQADRFTGVTCNDSCIMTPSKSVTAIMGIADRKSRDRQAKCATCPNKENCNFSCRQR